MPTPREAALAEHPDFPFLEARDRGSIESLAHRLGYLHHGESIADITKAGEGNMNLVLRLRTGRRSMILKQARPWVEKYDMIAAPWDRVVSERRFYERIRGVDGVADRMPKLLGHDDATRTLLLEDLGPSSDLSGVYAGEQMTDAEIADAAKYLRKLHDHTAGERGDDFANRAMRELNHAHIYDIPLTDHGMVDLDQFEPGLSEVAAELRGDKKLIAAMRATGEHYLADADKRSMLLHGDFFPGSLLRSPSGLRVIDPEFCFAGDRVFDVGVFVGHLVLAGADAQIDVFFDNYGRSALDRESTWRIAGCEVIRRLIGVAQLPIPKTDGRRAELLRLAQKYVTRQI